jgi:acetyltransferase-like isoleucine patch superfamily enzyme
VKLFWYIARSLRWRSYSAWQSACRFPHALIEPSVRWRVAGSVGIERDVYLGSNTTLLVPRGAELLLGRGVRIGADCELAPFCRVEIGARTSLQNRSQIHGDVTIGSGCVGAANLYISSAWHEFARAPALPIRVQEYQRVRSTGTQLSHPVAIGDDCWLGINVVVMPGVTIGRGCIVGANSVITGDLPPYIIAAGAPARQIGVRLQFAPPRHLDATADADLPYFYAGFRQLGATEAEDAAPVRVRGGWPVASRFVLALATVPGELVSVTVDAAVPGVLSHGAEIRPVIVGRQVIRFPAQAASGGFLSFTWRPERGGALETAVVTDAYVETPGADRAANT